ncbi:MAG TPA: family 43 glycosylhydrolase, partial [Polyangiaceae bacterium]
GPQLYRRGKYYYLISAEGGTGSEHAVTVARSRALLGPYEVDPQTPLLTSCGRPDLPLQRAGHTSLVETERGEPYIAHLCSRPIGPERRSILGRETALQRCAWTPDGWLRLATGEHFPAEVVRGPALPSAAFIVPSGKDDFDAPRLQVQYQTLRTPADSSWLSLAARPSQLRLWGREAPSSLHRQSVVARRVQTSHCRATTLVEFNPEHFMALAGLLCWYDTRTHYYLAITRDETLGRCLRLFMTSAGVVTELMSPVPLQRPGRVLLRAEIAEIALHFSFALEGEPLTGIGPICDATLLSDEAPKGIEPFHGSFTGAMFGVGAHDMSGGRAHADFEYLWYEDIQHGAALDSDE